MAWRRSGDKPLFEPMMVSLQTHICVTRPQWVNTYNPCQADLFRKFMKIYLYFLLFLDTKYANLVQILSRRMQWSICQYRISARCQIHFPNTAEPWREQKKEKKGRQTGTGREKEKHRDRFYFKKKTLFSRVFRIRNAMVVDVLTTWEARASGAVNGNLLIGLSTNFRIQYQTDKILKLKILQLHLDTMAYHADAIKWKRFARYWPVVREIHRSPK